MNAIALMINTVLLIPIVIIMNDCVFNHAYIYLVNFTVFYNLN